MLECIGEKPPSAVYIFIAFFSSWCIVTRVGAFATVGFFGLLLCSRMMMPFGGSSSGAKNPMLQSEEQVLRNAHHDAQCDISATSSGSSDSGSSSGASSGSNSPTTHHEDDNGLSVRHSSSSGDGGNAIALSTSKAPIRHRSTPHGSGAAPGRPQSSSLSTQGGVLAQQQQRASSNKVYHTPHQSMKQSHPAIPASNTIHLVSSLL